MVHNITSLRYRVTGTSARAHTHTHTHPFLPEHTLGVVMNSNTVPEIQTDTQSDHIPKVSL